MRRAPPYSGLREDAQWLARRNIDALENGGYDAILMNAAGCGLTLKEYGELLADDPLYSAKARAFAAQMRDVSEFLAGIELNREITSASDLLLSCRPPEGPNRHQRRFCRV